jgi:catechol 2,3-dioxygenase-like lactoylglutathione lyase family enzyme
MGVKTSFNHLQIYVSDTKISFPFYKKLLTYMGYKVVHEDATHLGMRNAPTDIWFKEVSKEHKIPKYHRKKVGINHLAFRVSKKEDVDKFYQKFLIPQNIKPLYNTPKNFPKYTKKYYAVFFEDPDRIKLEVVFL